MKLIVLINKGCVQCRQIEQHLKSSTIDYEINDIRNSKELIEKYKPKGVPFFILENDKQILDKWRGVEPLFNYIQGGWKMKAIKFNTRVTDKKTGEAYEPEQIKMFANGRAAEIVATGYAEYVEIEDTKTATKPKTEEKPKAKKSKAKKETKPEPEKIEETPAEEVEANDTNPEAEVPSDN